jgi:hypothetical protein
VLLALRDALGSADGGRVRLSVLARELDADPEVVRATLLHAIARGWLPAVELSDAVDGCGPAACRPVATNAACRRCPLAP